MPDLDIAENSLAPIDHDGSSRRSSFSLPVPPSVTRQDLNRPEIIYLLALP